MLRAFPDDAYHALTAMSERALAYTQVSLVHRFLIIYEAAGLGGELASYLVRSLLSEGRLHYTTVESTRDGLKSLELSREGPTGLIITTTASALHPENETRMFSITVRDDSAQTRAVLRSAAVSANDDRPDPPDLEPWHALQLWLAGGERRVAIPYAEWLAENTDCWARHGLAHAILHQASRERDAEGRIVATVDDYAAVHDLVAAIVSQGAKAMVSYIVHETVRAVAYLFLRTRTPVSRSQVARLLSLDPSAAGRRLQAAVHEGYLARVGSGNRRRWLPGDRLPGHRSVLPSPDLLRNGLPAQGPAPQGLGLAVSGALRAPETAGGKPRAEPGSALHLTSGTEPGLPPGASPGAPGGQPGGGEEDVWDSIASRLGLADWRRSEGDGDGGAEDSGEEGFRYSAVLP